ncbi:MAG: CDP-glycerol glycerophosphotransferase family protein [Vreelandella alkaliphila]|uniref:CDP-glycerol glycerophosphotransferase family protein n=1 Tax=Vreelandella alkaliphila TaxID=272774 RepID=UPI003F950902
MLLSLPVSLFVSLAGWLFIAPVACLMPRRKDLVAVIGRQDGQFIDNAKYFFLQADATEPNIHFVYVTERVDVEKMVKERGGQVVRYPSLKGGFFLLRCAVVVVDEVSWYRSFRFFCLIGAQTVQLWHGVGFKWVEAKLWEHQIGRIKWLSHHIVRKFRVTAYKINGRRMRYSTVLCTSSFYCEEVFKPAFIARNFLVAGYPRNDFAQVLSGKHINLAWCNVDTFVRRNLGQWQANGKRIVMVAPTFRDSGSSPMQLDDMTLKKIDEFAVKNKIEFIFKFHPSEKNIDRIAGQHFHICARDSDVYPLFPYLSALVTDYSSISTDFLLVDKPLFFLLPENDDYVEKDRQLQFDPLTLMPGVIVSNWNFLLNSLLKEWERDNYQAERIALCSKAFDDLPQSEAVPTLIEMMKENGWVNTK